MAHIDLVDDPERFSARAAGFLAAEPVASNVIAAVLARTLAGELRPRAQDRWIVAEDDRDAVVGVGMANAPYNLFLSAWPDAAVDALVAAMVRAGLTVPGVTAPRSTAQRFSDGWRDRTACAVRLQIGHHALVLDRLVPPDRPAALGGHARPAVAADAPVVAGWLAAFHDEALPHDPDDDHAATAAARIGAGELWVWDLDGAPAAMVARSVACAGTARLGPVYTPPRHRGRGLAAHLCAAVIADALDGDADQVMLYADRSNATSNGVYRRLGFVPHHDADDLGFLGGNVTAPT